MISPELFQSLDADEQKLWHSHVFEVKSGTLIMSNPTIPESVWEKAETKEMESVICLYGKVYHLWQTDKHFKVPLGEPKLMTSFTSADQLDPKRVKQRDERFGIDSTKKEKARASIVSPEIHESKSIDTHRMNTSLLWMPLTRVDADQTWKQNTT